MRTHDRDASSAICTPAAAMSGLFALHALAMRRHVRSATSQESARARLAWWRNAAGHDRRAAGLPSRAGAGARSPSAWLTRYLHQLVDAREADLRVQQPRDVEEMRQYCERNAGSLLLLGLECAGVSGSDAADALRRTLGPPPAWRRSCGHRGAASQGCTYIPAEVTSRHGVRLTEMLRGNPSNELCDAVAEVADEAVAHLLAARSMRPDVPPEVRALLLPTVVADHILARLQNCGYSPFAQELHAPSG